MPARPLPRTPLPTLRFECVWQDCTNKVWWEWRRNKPRLRLYCDKHRREHARLNRKMVAAGLTPFPRWGKRTGHLMVRIGSGKFLPWHVVRYEQLLGRKLDGEYVVTPEGPQVVSFRNMRLWSPAQVRVRLAYGRMKREQGGVR